MKLTKEQTGSLANEDSMGYVFPMTEEADFDPMTPSNGLFIFVKDSEDGNVHSVVVG
jgi:hypothetical protein